MSEERKSPLHEDALRDCAADLQRFARALLAPCATQTADQLAKTALARSASADRATGDARERVFAEALRLNRRRIRDNGARVLGEAGKDSGAAMPDLDRRDPGIAGLIGAMPLDEREILLIVALAGFGYDAAARILDIPRASVVSRLMRARARLDGVRAGPASRVGHLRLVK